MHKLLTLTTISVFSLSSCLGGETSTTAPVPEEVSSAAQELEMAALLHSSASNAAEDPGDGVVAVPQSSSTLPAAEGVSSSTVAPVISVPVTSAPADSTPPTTVPVSSTPATTVPSTTVPSAPSTTAPSTTVPSSGGSSAAEELRALFVDYADGLYPDPDAYGACVVDAFRADGLDLDKVSDSGVDPDSYEMFLFYEEEETTVGEIRIAAQVASAAGPCEREHLIASIEEAIDTDLAAVSSIVSVPSSYSNCRATASVENSYFTSLFIPLFDAVAAAPLSADSSTVEDYLDQIGFDTTADTGFDPEFDADAACGGYASQILERAISEIEVIDADTLRFTFVGGAAAAGGSVELNPWDGDTYTVYWSDVPFSAGDTSGLFSHEDHGFLGGDEVLVSFGSSELLFSALTLTGATNTVSIPEDACDEDNRWVYEILFDQSGEYDSDTFWRQPESYIFLNCDGRLPERMYFETEEGFVEALATAQSGDRVAVVDWTGVDIYELVDVTDAPSIDVTFLDPPIEAVLLPSTALRMEDSGTSFSVTVPKSLIDEQFGLSVTEMPDVNIYTLLLSDSSVRWYGTDTYVDELTFFYRDTASELSTLNLPSEGFVHIFVSLSGDAVDAAEPDSPLRGFFYVTIPVSES